MILAKICILGAISVGKTSLIRRYVDRAFSDAYLSTVGVNISRKAVTLPAEGSRAEVPLQLILWDLEGGFHAREIASSYLKGATGAVVVGDLSRRDTLEAIDGYLHEFRRVNPGGHAFVALSKSDLLAPGSADDSLRWGAAEGVVSTFRTSARTGEGVDRLFDELAIHIYRRGDHGSAHR